jgi:hypothetical protein
LPAYLKGFFFKCSKIKGTAWKKKFFNIGGLF